jgi:hypothetical protein
MNRDQEIVKRYQADEHARKIAQDFDISERQVQRIVSKAGVSRSISQSYSLAIEQGRMKYYKKPEHLKKRRKTLTLKARYTILNRDDFTCVQCGSRPDDGIRLEIDHIDEDATNNVLDNLQTLCNLCNQGKANQ